MRHWLRHLPTGGRALLVIVLTIAGIGTWWWLREQRDAGETVQARHPDSYFRELDVIRHDANGKPEMRVKAEYAEHFEQETWIHLQELEARGLAAGPDWQLTANRGRLTDDGVELDAWGDVVLTHVETGGEPMQLQTEKISVNTETEIAVTDAPVLITQGPSRLSGRGLWASLADDRLRIESNVEARYEK